VSSSNPLYKAKAAAETENAGERDAPRADTTMTASQPRKTEKGEEEEIKLRMPGYSTPGITRVQVLSVRLML